MIDEDIPIDVLIDVLASIYSGAGKLEAAALVDHLADAGWVIVRERPDE